MNNERRRLIQAALTAPVLLSTSGALASTGSRSDKPGVAGPIRRIAVEEAFTTTELLLAQRKLLADNPADEPGFTQFWGGMMDGIGIWGLVKELTGLPGSMGMTRALNLGEDRIQVMDEAGIAVQVLSVTSPGVQVYEASQAHDLAQSTNEKLGEAVRKHPDRFAGLATIAPQNPGVAATELKRAVQQLGMKGALINSHTKGEFLDETRYWPIFEMAQQLDVPVYIHPRVPAPDMVGPFQKYFGLEAATFGFPMDASLHALRLILSGLFDDMPDLKIVLGHMGEGLPFWLDRIDKKIKLFQSIQPPKRKLRYPPSHYFHNNFYISTSGMNYEAPLMLANKVVGPDRIMFAVDYPFEESEEPVRFMDNVSISAEDRHKIYHGTAEKVFKLNTAA